jgi:type IV pilus assembly protein PilQ
LAAASVYSYQAIRGTTGSEANNFASAAAHTAPARHLAKANAAALPGLAKSETLIAAPEGATDVKLLDESTDPFASGAAPTSQPSKGGATASATGTDGAAAPTSQPSEGRSVSSSEVSVSDAGTVEIHVNDANLVEVLRMLSLQSQKNIIASKDVHGTVTANLYDVTVREALDAILHANGYAYREKGSFIYVYTTKEIAEIEKAEKQMKTEVFRTYYMPATDAATMIKPVLSASGGQVAVSAPAKVGINSAPNGGGGDSYSHNDVLVVTDYPENLEAVKRLLADIDHRPQQILLEATILRATLNEDNALGVDFNIMGGVDLAGLVNGGPQITNSGVNDASAAPPGAVLPNGGVVQPTAHSVGTGSSFTNNINGGLKVGYVTDSVSLFLSALEQVTDTTILANPKVLALNKQQGEVFVGNEDGYYTTLTTETTTSQSVESLKTGTRLIFRPYIANDGYIRMEVHPEDSDGQVKANGLPSKSTTEVTSNIMVKDGHTIVIGGLFRESTVSGKSQVPFLGNIPLAGLLFKSQRDVTRRDEVIILLTPHVVKDDAAYSRLSEEELKRTEELRVGVRKGLMPWGRERLAEGWYEAAKREMAKPNPNRSAAKFDLDCATNLNPKFLEAIELKEEITGHEVTQADNSSMRSFVRRAMMTDVVPSTQPMRTAWEDADQQGPTTMPTETAEAAQAPASQPVASAPVEEEMPEPTDVADSLKNNDASSETAESPTTAPIHGTAEASISDESVAIPSTTQPAGAATQSTEMPEDASDSKDVLIDPLASPSTTQPSDSSSTNTTTVTPLEEEVPGQIKDESSEQSN